MLGQYSEGEGQMGGASGWWERWEKWNNKL